MSTEPKRLEMWDVIVRDFDVDDAVTFTFGSLAEAEAFKDGVEYVNDDAIQAVEIRAWIGHHDPEKDEFVEDEPEVEDVTDDFDEALWEERMLHGPEGNRL